MEPLRVFLSFDLEHDGDLNEQLLAQAREHAIFAISHRSEDGAVSEGWSERARSRIAASDEVVVICGEHSDDSARMSAELKIAQEEKKPYVLLWGRRGRMCKKPRGARSADCMYSWASGVLEDQLIALRPRRPDLRSRRS
jgi:hypothetical protein